MRDLAFILFLVGLLGLGLRRPFLFVLAFTYVDIVSPQRLSYYLLNSIPISLITAGLAVGAWLLLDDKRNLRIAPRQWLLLILLMYAGVATIYADFPEAAQDKWDWVWRALVWAIFLPLTLRTKLRLESYLLFMTLSAAAIIIVGGMKTAVSGGGYGVLNLMVENDSGLYEGSILSTFAIALIPIILWLARFGTIFPRDWRVRTFALCLVFACLLIPIGTEARTGLVCIAVAAVLMLRDVKRRFLYIGLVAAVGLAAVPFLPQTFTKRMSTIQDYQSDASAGTRLAVWGWTWDYVQEHPLGGGFDSYLGNTLRFTTTATQGSGPVAVVNQKVEVDQGRAFHSSYFEMLGEHGFPGLTLFLLIHGIGLLRMEALRRRFMREKGERAWISPLATALQSAHIIYLVGSLFVGIAFQPFAYMLVGVQIGFDTFVKRKYAPARVSVFPRTPGSVGQAAPA